MSRAADPECAARICLALMRIGTRLAAGFDREFAEHGLTQGQFRMLIAAANLEGTEQATPSGLADFLLIERATVSVLLKPLLAKRLLLRLPSADARSFRVKLSAEGAAALQRLKPPAIAAAQLAVSGVAAARLPELESLLADLERQIRS